MPEALSNLLEEIRTCYLLHRLQYGYSAPTGYDILKIATVGSAKLLGRDDIGSLEIGKAVDLFLIDTNRFEVVGAMVDPKSVLATVDLKGPVDYTVINGKVVVQNGRLVSIDEERTQWEADRCFQEFIRK